MRYFGWLSFLVAILLAGFAIQNSALPVLPMRFLMWQVETSPVYIVLGSLMIGVLITALLWVLYALRESFLKRDLRKQVKALKGRIEKMEDEMISKDLDEHEGVNGVNDRIYDLASRRSD